MIITKEWLEKNKTANGGYTKHHLRLLGVSIPPAKGWRHKLIGTNIDNVTVKLFESVKEYYKVTNKTKRKKGVIGQVMQDLTDNDIDFDIYDDDIHLKIHLDGLTISNLKNGMRNKQTLIADLLEQLNKLNCNKVDANNGLDKLFGKEKLFSVVCNQCGSVDIEIIGERGQYYSEYTGYEEGSTAIKCNGCGCCTYSLGGGLER